MKKFLISAVLCIPSLVFANKIEVGVEGMVCGSCANKLKKAFEKISGLEKIDVNVEKKLVTLTTQEKKNLNDDLIKKTIVNTGYKVTKIDRKI